MTKAMVRRLRTGVISSCLLGRSCLADPGPIDGRAGRIIF
ncbi:hypothetical protein J3R08_001139 [Micromonospora sp. HB375]|nr:hypothetical protein [Micromonospora sp. HB375]MDH6471047.1 hypothetical protein [Micromonospora sp. H404/HB375]